MENIQQLIDEAEQRGYIRGRNEQIETRMLSPGVWQSSPPSPSIWDRT